MNTMNTRQSCAAAKYDYGPSTFMTKFVVILTN